MGVVLIRSGYSSNYVENRVASLANWITKTERAHNFLSWSFHHILRATPSFSIIFFQD